MLAKTETPAAAELLLGELAFGAGGGRARPVPRAAAGAGSAVSGWEAAGSSVKTGLSGLYPVYAQAYREAARSWASSRDNCNPPYGW